MKALPVKWPRNQWWESYMHVTIPCKKLLSRLPLQLSRGRTRDAKLYATQVDSLNWVSPLWSIIVSYHKQSNSNGVKVWVWVGLRLYIVWWLLTLLELVASPQNGYPGCSHAEKLWEVYFGIRDWFHMAAGEAAALIILQPWMVLLIVTREPYACMKVPYCNFEVNL